MMFVGCSQTNYYLDNLFNFKSMQVIPSDASFESSQILKVFIVMRAGRAPFPPIRRSHRLGRRAQLGRLSPTYQLRRHPTDKGLIPGRSRAPLGLGVRP
jgi:hypothetical protein